MHRAVAALLTLLVLAPAARGDSVEVFAPDGTIGRVAMELPAAAPLAPAEAAALATAPVTAIQHSGATANRLDIVFIGDGYTAAEQELFREHARAKWLAIRRTSPFSDYADHFNVWMVDVVSPESGVDNDPRPPTMRDTALDMQFWCNGTERLLCVDQAKASAAAAAAPAADQIVVLANSTKYGGAGGTVATSSGGSLAASLITVHELGHSLGGLADEYDYYYRAGLAEDSTQDVTIPAPYLLYPPVLGEPAGVNVTAASTPEALVSQRLKWWRWVGAPSPDGGTVGTFEGAGYYRFGLYRPSTDSLMHSLGIAEGGNPFNPPSAEQLIGRFYAKVNPVDARTPQSAVAPDAVLTLKLVEPTTHALDVSWKVDGTEVEGARGQRSFPLSAELLEQHATVTATVTDPTALVRDPALQGKELAQTVSWTI